MHLSLLYKFPSWGLLSALSNYIKEWLFGINSLAKVILISVLSWSLQIVDFNHTHLDHLHFCYPPTTSVLLFIYHWITQADVTTPRLKEYHERLQPFVLWFIDGSSYIGMAWWITFSNWRASCKKGVYRFFSGFFHFLQDQANFWQTDLCWHEKHCSVIDFVGLRFFFEK